MIWNVNQVRLIVFNKLRFNALAPHGFALHTLLCEAVYVTNHLVYDVLATEAIFAIPERRQHCDVIIGVKIIVSPKHIKSSECVYFQDQSVLACESGLADRQSLLRKRIGGLNPRHLRLQTMSTTIVRF